MPAITTKRDNPNNIKIVKKLKDYSNEPAFKKKAEEAIQFLKKHGLPESFKKKKKK